MQKTLAASYLGSLLSVGVAACCVLPVTLMLIGVGGSWLAIFAPIASAAVYVLSASTLMLVFAWSLAYRRGVLGRLLWKLSGSTVLTGIAWGVLVFERPLNDYLIGFL